MKNCESELFIDDRPIDFSKYDYNDEEWERLYQESFGDLSKTKEETKIKEETSKI